MSSQVGRISKKDVQCIYPLGAMQKGMLFHQLCAADAQPYFRQVSFRIEGGFNPTLCESTWNELMARHELLRSAFDYENTSQLLQIVLKQRSVAFAAEDLGHLEERAQRVCLDRYRADDRKRGFDLRRDSLMRVHVFQLGSESFEMIWSHPHILLDGWSGSVLLSEFMEIYTARRQHLRPALSEAPCYSLYLDWLAARDVEASRNYWSGLLSGYEHAVTVPRTSRNASARAYQPEEHSFQLGSEQTAALQQLAARNGVTVNAVMLGVWGVLLGRYNDAPDVVFGSVVSGRPPEVPGIERMVGLFINTKPVRIRLRLGQSFAALLTETQHQSIESGPHEHLALPEIRTLSPVEPSLIDHLLVFENYPEDDLAGATDAAGFVVKSVRSFERANYDFGLLIHPGAALGFSFNYNGSVYSAAQMGRLEGHLRTLIDQVLEDDRIAVERLEILTVAERRALAAMAKGPRVAFPSEKTLMDLWEAQVEKSPESTALVFGPAELSYRELNERANRLAHFLHDQLSVQLEERVGVLADRGVGRIVALLGILKAGGAYLPLSPSFPDMRIDFMIEDSSCRVVLADAANTPRLEGIRPGLAVALESLVQLEKGARKQEHRKGEMQPGCAGPFENPGRCGTARNLAYVIYTSGSTGQSKGVMVEHGGFVNMILEQVRGFGITRTDRVLQFASCSFDASLSEIFMALLGGGCLVLIDEDVIHDGQRFVTFLQERSITVLTLPPSYLRALDRTELAGLRVLLTAGEPPNEPDSRHCAARLRCFNAYGPTEASVCAAYHEVRANDPYPLGIPVGRPLVNTQVRILDQSLRPVPLGVPGEICLAGPGLARGYLNQPELTRRCFIVSPFEREPRLYRTGDLGCWLEDGSFVVLGRQDTQVKLRGYRIELGEIENLMRNFAGIQDAVAVVHAGGNDGQLIAYFTATNPPDLSALRGHLSSALPPYMVPSAFVQIPAIPRSIAGKVDRKALPAPGTLTSTIPTERVRPRNAAEQSIASAWEEVLGQTDFGIHDSFFDLGGDSIKTILLAGRLRRRGLRIEIPEIIRRKTVAEMASVATGAEPDAKNVTGTAPLTPIQRWFFDEHSTGLHHLNHCVLLEARNPILEAPLRAALTALWVHHDALRLRFRRDPAGVVQEIADASTSPGFEVVDLRFQLNPWPFLKSHADALQPGFDLQNGPLLKAIWYRLAEGDAVLLLAHHLVVDALSWRFLLEDFSEAYRQALEGVSVRLPAKSDSYQKWACLLSAYSQSEALLGQKGYWRNMETAEVRPLPSDAPASLHSYDETETITLEVPYPDKPYSLADASVQAIVLTALADALKDWDGRPCTRVLLSGHGREPIDPAVDVSRTAGWFTSNFPFLLSVPEASDPVDRLETIRVSLDQIPAKGIGYGVLRYLTPSESKTDICFASEPEISLNCLGRIEATSDELFKVSERLPNASVGKLERFRLFEFEAMLSGAALILSLRFCPRLNGRHSVARLTHALQERLGATLKNFLQQTQERRSGINSYELRPSERPSLVNRG